MHEFLVEYKEEKVAPHLWQYAQITNGQKKQIEENIAKDTLIFSNWNLFLVLVCL